MFCQSNRLEFSLQAVLGRQQAEAMNSNNSRSQKKDPATTTGARTRLAHS
jgi:hypothetical protein